MKNYITIYITIVSVLSFNCFGQKMNVFLDDKKIVSTQIRPNPQSEMITESVRVVEYYHVEEKINMNFGSCTTTYEVSDLKLVRTNDLGPNNTRIVTPRFAKETKLTDYKSKKLIDTLKSTSKSYNSGVVNNPKKNEKYTYIDVLKTHEMVADKGSKFNDLGPNNIKIVFPSLAEETKLADYQRGNTKDTLKSALDPIKLGITEDSKKHNNYLYIDVLKTYERVLEKGYKSIDMFQKIGNAYFFNNELEKAAKWYTELFAMTSDLEPVYYYRYSQSLKAVGQNDKAMNIMGKFVLKNKQNDSAKILLKNSHYEK